MFAFRERRARKVLDPDDVVGVDVLRGYFAATP
jgi:hypothetical protein